MTDNNEVGFPTQGDIIRFLYKTFGVLPEKRDPASDLDERQRKNLQKALERLAAEEGMLEENFGDMIRQLAYLVAGYIQSDALNLAIGEVLFDLLDGYSQLFREEGTYLSKHETLHWLILERWAPSAAVAIARQITRFGLRPFAPFFPDDWTWFLPRVAGEESTSPLAKVMRWIYETENVSQIRFHCPPNDMHGSASSRERDLETAQNWTSGRNLPSAAALRWTFGRAFDALASGLDGSDAAAVRSLAHREGAQMALFLARGVSFVASEINKHFGSEYLLRVCTDFNQVLLLALNDSLRAEAYIDELAKRENINPLTPRLRSYVVDCWNKELRSRIQEATAALTKLRVERAHSKEDVEQLLHEFGALAVLPLIAHLEAPPSHEVPAAFLKALFDGLTLTEDKSLSHQRVDAYAAGLDESEAAPMLPWMVPWLRFQICYRQEDETRAWEWISKAFEGARYRAGKHQYQIVNHYVELAAKTSKKREFKKGAEWARYIGLSIRWLRDRELTDENIDFAMTVLKRARYSV